MSAAPCPPRARRTLGSARTRVHLRHAHGNPHEETAIDLRVHPDEATLARAAADVIAAAVTDAVARAGRCAIAFSGGRGPGPMLGALARRDVPWSRVQVFQVDERVAAEGHADRNLTLLRTALLDRVPIPDEHIHPMPVEDDDLDAAAAAYDQVLTEVAGGRLDVVHLGLGPDGHAASWPPGDAVVDARALVAATGRFNGYRRLTLTPRAIATAPTIVWLVSGRDKRPALTRLLAGDPTIPATRAKRDGAIVLADAAAAPDGGAITE